jgi:hypothetical protein
VTPEQEAELAVTARMLKLIHAAMAGGILMMGAVVGFFYVQNAAKVPPENAFATLRLLSAVAAVMTAAAWTASSVLFKTLAAKASGPAGVQTAFIVRAALREGPALLGLVICMLGALNGALRVQPVFWAASLPAWLFVGWIALSLPDERSLRDVLDASAQNR